MRKTRTGKGARCVRERGAYSRGPRGRVARGRLDAATDGARDTSQIDVAALHERDRVITEGLHGPGACQAAMRLSMPVSNPGQWARSRPRIPGPRDARSAGRPPIGTSPRDPSSGIRLRPSLPSASRPSRSVRLATKRAFGQWLLSRVSGSPSATTAAPELRTAHGSNRAVTRRQSGRLPPKARRRPHRPPARGHPE